jgi:hypothetical protein
MNSVPLQIEYGSYKSVLKLETMPIPCFILNNKQRVLAISGIHKTFGYDGKSEFWLLNILNLIAKYTKISKEILLAYEKPIAIEIKNAKEQFENSAVIDCNLFIETCKIIVDAKSNGLLSANTIKVSKTAESFLKKTSNRSIDQLIDIATGYVVFKEHVKDSLGNYMEIQLHDESCKWVKTFPDHFFEILFDLHNGDWKSTKANPKTMEQLFCDVVFSRVSTELMIELRAMQPKRSYNRKGNQPQDLQHPKLKNMIENIISLLKTSGNNWFIFMQLLNRTYPVNAGYKTKL